MFFLVETEEANDEISMGTMGEHGQKVMTDRCKKRLKYLKITACSTVFSSKVYVCMSISVCVPVIQSEREREKEKGEREW